MLTKYTEAGQTLSILNLCAIDHITKMLAAITAHAGESLLEKRKADFELTDTNAITGGQRPNYGYGILGI